MNDLLEPAYAAARWGWYLAAFLVLGAVSYAPFLFRGPSRFRGTFPSLAPGLTRGAARLGWWGAVGLAGFGLLRLWLQARSLSDPEEPLTREFVATVLATRWGTGWKLQGGAALLTLLGFGLGRAGGWGAWIVVLIGAAGLALSAGMTGHAVTAQAGGAGWLLDGLHVFAGGLWLGGLTVMILVGFPLTRGLNEDRVPALRALVAEFSRRALVLAPVTVALGVWIAARYLGWGWPLRFTDHSYGLTLGAKVAAVALAGVAGAYNWRIAQPRMGHPAGAARLKRSGVLELGLGVVILGLTAVLVALPFPEAQ